MFGESDLRDLAAYEAETPLLSVYLNVDPRQQSTEEYRLELRQQLKRASKRASRADIDAVQSFFDQLAQACDECAMRSHGGCPDQVETQGVTAFLGLDIQVKNDFHVIR